MIDDVVIWNVCVRHVVIGFVFAPLIGFYVYDLSIDLDVFLCDLSIDYDVVHVTIFFDHDL